MNGTRTAGGFSLMEVVISVAVIAIIIPIVMALTVAGGEGSSEAADETRSILIVQSVLQEIERASNGQGLVYEGTIGWPDFPEEGEIMAFTVDRAGGLRAVMNAEEFATGTRDLETAFIVSAAGQLHEPPGITAAGNLSKVEITVGTPPGAPESQRRKMRFVRLLHRDD